jgi:pimeloyl-ACP methyl ester carboxylesterase
MSTPPYLDVPAGVRRENVTTRRGELAALTASPAEKSDRSPVVLVPGIFGSKEDFIAVIAPIAAAGHRVTALDQRGQFESHGDADAASYDLMALAEEILDVARSLGGPVHLLGHSFGGLVARAAALASPGSVRSLTLLDSGPGAAAGPTSSNLGLLVQALPVMDLATIWVAKRQLETQSELTPPPPDIEDWMRRRFLANHPTSLLRIAEQLLCEPDRVDALAALDLPVLVAYGETEDAWPPPLQAEMAERLRAAHVEIAGAGHSPAADKPEVTAQVLIDFWAMVESEG